MSPRLRDKNTCVRREAQHAMAHASCSRFAGTIVAGTEAIHRVRPRGAEGSGEEPVGRLVHLPSVSSERRAHPSEKHRR